MNDFVSVIIPVYNRKSELARAINSVLRQTYGNFEIIVIDDFSENDIKGVVESFRDARVKYIRSKRNMGVSYSRNAGIKEAKYDIIALLDSDDEWKSNKLKLQLKYLNEHKDCNVLHTEEIWIRNNKRVNQGKRHKKSGGDIFINSLELCLMSPSSIMIKKFIFEKYGCFNENLPVCEDYDLWLKITAFEEVGFIEKPLIFKYGGHPDQLSRKYEAMDKYRILSLMDIYGNLDIDQKKKEKVKITALKKIHILVNGAKKRNKTSDLIIYEDWQKKFS